MKPLFWPLFLLSGCVVDGSLGSDLTPGSGGAGGADEPRASASQHGGGGAGTTVHPDSGVQDVTELGGGGAGGDVVHDAGDLGDTTTHGGGGGAHTGGGAAGTHAGGAGGGGLGLGGGGLSGVSGAGGAAGHAQGDEPAVDAGAHSVCEAATTDTDCSSCQKERCCEAFVECTRHTPCLCVSECLAPGVSVPDCQAHCEIAAFPELDALTSCAIDQCGDVCR
jgi:hypothetical protein